MKKSALLLLALSLFTLKAFGDELFQFPIEGHRYSSQNSADRGFGQYLAPSLHHTKEIVLTFDDGPDPIKTPRLLDILKKHNATATFFVLAEKITESTLPIIHRMLSEGHIVASHDWNHTNNNKETKEIFKNDLKKSILKLKNIQEERGIVHNEIYFRFPYGDYGRTSSYHHLNVMKEVSDELFGENCINFVFWDIDTADWVPSMTPSEIAEGIIAHIEGGRAFTHKKSGNGYIKSPYMITGKSILGGGVVLMHDIHDRSVDATELFLQYAEKNNISIVPLSGVKEFAYENRVCQMKE